MPLDLRIPIGLMFVLLGALIGAYGALSNPAPSQASLGININAWWGAVMFLFGSGMLGSAWRGARGRKG